MTDTGDQYLMHLSTAELLRIASALERIADAFEVDRGEVSDPKTPRDSVRTQWSDNYYYYEN